MRDGCCGNFVCEAGENGSNCSQDCTFTLPTPELNGPYYVPYGVQFDIQAINDIDISKIIFRVRDRDSTNIKVYTAAGSYNDAEVGDWTLVASESIATSSEFFSAWPSSDNSHETSIDLLHLLPFLNPPHRSDDQC